MAYLPYFTGDPIARMNPGLLERSGVNADSLQYLRIAMESRLPEGVGEHSQFLS